MRMNTTVQIFGLDHALNRFIFRIQLKKVDNSEMLHNTYLKQPEK